MAAKGYPKWLLDSKEGINSTKEWNAFLHELHDAIQQQLTESHVQYFSDLSEAEKELFIQRATKAIDGGTAYGNLYKKVSLILDQNMNEEVSRALLEDAPFGTKSDLIVECAEEGSLSLLKKWPDMKTKLHHCLNQPLSVQIRQLAWKLYLSNTKVRKQYIDLLNTDPRRCISQYDYEITQKCEQLLSSERTFSDLRGSSGVFFGMKAVLSYFHAKQGTQTRLRDVDHLLIVPFMQVSSPAIPRKDPPSGRVVAELVEEFFTYMESRPGFVVDSGSDTHNEEMKGFVDKVAKLLQEHYPDVTKIVVSKFVPSKEKIVKTDTGNYQILIDGLTKLVRPMIRSMFVGYMRMDTLLYVWDQYVIGLDTPGFNVEWLSIVTAITLGLLKEQLKECTSPNTMEVMLKQEAPKLTIAQFQYEVKKHHYQKLWSMLHQDGKAAMPVLDPTQAIHPPWRHWYNDVIPPYTKPQDRRRAREEREAERERLSQQRKSAEHHKKEISEKTRREEEEENMKRTAEDRERVEQERMALEDQLAEERRRRKEEEKRNQEEKERLMMEINFLKSQRQPSRGPSTYSISSNISRILVAPPPSNASGSTVPTVVPTHEPRTPTPEKDPYQQAEDGIKDFMAKVAAAMNRIAHADGSEKETLDRETEGFLQRNVRDIKKAQMEIFGRKLDPGEFDSMSPTKQQETSEQMMNLIQQWREERREQELKSGKR